MAKLIIHRSSEFANRIRAIRIYLDKEKIGEIMDGETKEFEIPAGRHLLQAKIDWCGSNEIEFRVHEGKPVTFSLFGTNPIYALYYITLARHSYLGLLQV